MSAPKNIRWDDEPRLGVMPDSELAVIHEVSKQAVAAARKKRGLPSPRRPGRVLGSVNRRPRGGQNAERERRAVRLLASKGAHE